MLKKDLINKYSFLVSAVVYAAVAFFMLEKKSVLLWAMPYVFIGVFAYNLIKSIIGVFIKEDKAVSFAEVIANAALLAIFVVDRNIYMAFISISAGIYIILIGMINIYSAYQYRKNKVGFAWVKILLGLASIVFGTLTVIAPYHRFSGVVTFMAVFFVLSAISSLTDFIDECIPRQAYKEYISKLKRIVDIQPSNLLSLGIPSRILNELNKYFKKYSTATPGAFDIRKTDQAPSLEVCIHACDTLLGRFGHIDIVRKGKVYSYGNYDDSSYRLGGLAGDGVIEVLEREAYTEFCERDMKKTIISFGILLNEGQIESFDKEMAAIIKQCVPWLPPAKAKRKEDKNCDISKFNDYASRLWKAAPDSLFYKYTCGKYKSYFGMNTNCARWVKEALSSCGIDIIKTFGVFNPGVFYQFLNVEVKKHNSLVISRTIYRSNNCSDFLT